MLLLSSVLFTAKAGASATQRPQIEQPRFFALSTQNGLAQDSVNDMLIDQRGFLYIGTEYGLERWDGHALKKIVGRDGKLKDVAIQRLFQDSKGFIWISTYTLGVYRLNPQTQEISLAARIPYPNDEEYFQTANDYEELPSGNILMAMDHQVVEYSPDAETLVTRFTLAEELREQEHIIR